MSAPLAETGSVALVHDWLVAQRGGEQVLLELGRLFPDAPIYTLVHAPGTVHPEIEQHRIITSLVQHLPGAPQRFRQYLPIFPAAVERWDLSAYTLVVSTSHCVAKGVRTNGSQRHIAYIHTPMRYLYDQLPAYLPALGREVLVPLARLATAPLRAWDVASSRRPTLLVANSTHISERIARVWGRNAEVVYPPVDVAFFAAAPAKARRGYLAVGALVPYKRMDLAVRWATQRGIDLTVAGDGPERAALQRIAGPTVRFVGSLDTAELRNAYAEAQALLFCGVEDFGLVPVEAMAAGCPVIALGAGGALETVIDGITGVLFFEATPQGLGDAVRRFEKAAGQNGAFSSRTLAEEAARFDRTQFIARMRTVVTSHLAK